MSEEMIQINLRLGRQELDALDAARPSTTPRTLWIRGAIRKRLGWNGAESRPPEIESVPMEIVAGFEAQPDGSRVFQTGHREGCKCLNCERARGSIVD